MAPRSDVVERLVLVALDAMTEAVGETGATYDEIMSAYFTLTRRGIQVGLTLAPAQAKTREALRQTLFTILAEVADDVRN